MSSLYHTLTTRSPRSRRRSQTHPVRPRCIAIVNSRPALLRCHQRAEPRPRFIIGECSAAARHDPTKRNRCHPDLGRASSAQTRASPPPPPSFYRRCKFVNLRPLPVRRLLICFILPCCLAHPQLSSGPLLLFACCLRLLALALR
jgi:hypothetical protein